MNLPREALLSPPRLSWPLVLLGVLLLAIVGVLLLAEHVVGAPARDVELLALFLSASGGLSLLIGALAIRWLGQRLGSLRQRLALASGVGLVIALVNVLTTSALMFLSPHDLTLLLLLLSFAAVVSLAFAYAVAGTLTSEISALSRTAQRLAEGDFSRPKLFAGFEDGHEELLLCEAILQSHRNEAWIPVRRNQTEPS